MEAENLKLNEFLNEVWEYMQTWNTYAHAIGNVSLDKVCSEPYAACKKLLKLFYRAFDPLHREWFNHFFIRIPIDHTSVKKVLEGHYYKVSSKSKSIFICFLYICSFTYSLMHYCERNRMDGMLIQVRTLLKAGFSNIEPRFNGEGGWAGLNRFCSSQNLPTILQFINHCYCEAAVLHTFVLFIPNVEDFGLHGRETLDLLMNNVQAFESAVREAFDKEINATPNCKKEVDEAFLKLRSDLRNGPFHNYLSKDRATIAADPTSPLSRI